MHSQSKKVAQKTNDILPQFDAAWAEGNPPRIETILHEVPESIRNRVFSRLVQIEMNYRRKSAQNLTLDEWQNRFPNQAKQLETLYLKHSLAFAISRIKCGAPVQQGCVVSLDELFVFQFKPKSHRRMIIIDSSFSVVHFHHCHTSRSFWPAPAQKWYSCLFRDVCSSSVFTMEVQNRRRQSSLSISTTTGKVVVPKVNNDFELLIGEFKIIVPENDEEYLIESEGMHIVTIYGTIVGLLLGGFLARNESDAVLAGSTVVGAIGGAVASYMAVLISRGKAFYPLLHGMIGMVIGGAAMIPMFGFDLTLPRILAVCLPSFALGMTYGEFRMNKR